MTRMLLSTLLLSCTLLLGCAAEPPAPGPEPAQPDAAARDPQAVATPIFTDDFEEGKAEGWTGEEQVAEPAAEAASEPAGGS